MYLVQYFICYRQNKNRAVSLTFPCLQKALITHHTHTTSPSLDAYLLMVRNRVSMNCQKKLYSCNNALHHHQYHYHNSHQMLISLCILLYITLLKSKMNLKRTNILKTTTTKITKDKKTKKQKQNKNKTKNKTKKQTLL